MNLVALGRPGSPQRNRAAVLGAVLPDLAIFLFYLVEKLVYGVPDRIIWGEAYFRPGPWQNFIDALHSLPLAFLGMLFFRRVRNEALEVLFASMMLHGFCDLALHHDDAHRHFFPFSDFRWQSPVSYWDPRHYGMAAAGAEAVLVLLASACLWRWRLGGKAKIALVAANLLYLAPLAFFLSRALNH